MHSSGCLGLGFLMPPPDQDELRRRFVAHWRAVDQICERARSEGLLPGDYTLPAYPEELRGLTCGALSKRTSEPCRQTTLYANGRCKFHGGLSTGPTSEAGKAQSRRNGMNGGRPKKEPNPM